VLVPFVEGWGPDIVSDETLLGEISADEYEESPEDKREVRALWRQLTQ